MEIVIVDAVRSAVGRAHKGSLALKRPDELAGEVIKALLARNPQVKPSDVEAAALPNNFRNRNSPALIQCFVRWKASG